MFDIPSNAPWFNNGKRIDGYKPDWTVDLNTTRIYFGVTNAKDSSGNPKYFNTDPNLQITTPDGVTHPPGVTPDGYTNMTVAQIKSFIEKGGLPVAFPGKYADVATAWALVYGS
jgi:hypothetical protein